MCLHYTCHNKTELQPNYTTNPSKQLSDIVLGCGRETGVVVIVIVIIIVIIFLSSSSFHSSSRGAVNHCCPRPHVFRAEHLVFRNLVDLTGQGIRELDGLRPPNPQMTTYMYVPTGAQTQDPSVGTAKTHSPTLRG